MATRQEGPTPSAATIAMLSASNDSTAKLPEAMQSLAAQLEAVPSDMELAQALQADNAWPLPEEITLNGHSQTASNSRLPVDILAIRDLTLKNASNQKGNITFGAANAPDTEADDDLDNDEDEEEGGRYRLAINHPRPKKISQRRQEDQAVWETFCERNSDIIVKQNSERLMQKQLEHKKQHQYEGMANSGSAFSDLIATAAAPKRIIHSAREYQVALFERCKTRNTIVVLDTGAREG